MSAPQPDYSESISFLQRWLPRGPWVLTSIPIERGGKDALGDGGTRTETFAASDVGRGNEGRLLTWLEEQGTERKRNVYFGVNQCLKRMKKKPTKADIGALTSLHVDVDPRAGEDLAEEQERIRKLLREPPPGIPKPSCIIFSGGGQQAFWRLSSKTAILFSGDPEDREEAGRYNRRLGELLGGDATHNVDRVMRLPGTLNRPDAKKRAKGRTLALARVEEFNDVLHDLSLFEKAEPKRSASSAAPKGTATEVSVDTTNVKRFASVDDIPELRDDSDARNAKCRVCIVQGHDPDEPFASRSEPLHFVCCQMVRAGCSDDAIYAVITDPEFPISASVLDKGSGTEDYAERQIRRAKEEVEADSAELVLDPSDPLPSARAFVTREAPELMHYNGGWLDYDGAAYREVEDGIIESRLYRFLEHAKKLQPKGKGWEEVPFKPNSARVSDVLRALRSVAIRARDQFEPPCWIGEPGPPPTEVISCANGLLHLPTGELLPPTPSFFTRNALALAFDPGAPEPTGWLRFLRELWAGDPDSIRVLQEAFGYLLVPDTSQQKLFFLKGPPRSGKGTIARILRELVGAANVCAPSLPSLGIHFGLEALVGKSLGIVSDARDSGRMEVQASIAENLLRITGEDQVSVPRKFRDALELKLSVRFLIMSNLRPKLPDASGALANRFVPIVMTESFLGREDPGLTARLLGELPGILNWAIDGWRRLRDRGYFEPSASGRALLVDLVEDASPVISFVRDECELDPLAQVPKDELYAAYREWRLIQGMSLVDARVFGKDMQAAFPKVEEKRPTIDGTRVRVYTGIGLAGTEAGRARRLLESWARRPDTTFGDEHVRAFERLWGEEDSYGGPAWDRSANW